MVLVQDLPGLRDVQVVLGADVPRHVEEPVEVRADPALLGRLLGCPLKPRELALRLRTDVLRHVRLGDPLAVLLDDVLLGALAELLADRVHLLAQDVVALLLVEALLDLLADLLLHTDLGERFLGPLQHTVQAPLHVERLQDLDLLFDRQVGRVAGHVGEPAG